MLYSLARAAWGSGFATEGARAARDWAFADGPPVPHEEYYLRGNPTFECSIGKHDWLTKHVFVGVGERRPDGNRLRYYALV